MADVEHNTLGNTANAHGIVAATVANAAALAAVTPSASDVSQRRVWLQSDTGQLWVPISTSAGSFVQFGPNPPGIMAYWAANKNFGSSTVKFVVQGAANNGLVVPGSEADSIITAPCPGVLIGIIATSSATIADAQALTARVATTDTALTCTIAGGATSANDFAHSAAFATGDPISVKYVQAASAASIVINLRVSLLYRAA